MLRIKITRLVLLAVFATGALAASSASAKPYSPLAYNNGGVILPIEKGDPAYLTASNAVLTTSAGDLTCASSQLTGAFQSNNLKIDTFELTGGTFDSCTSTTGLGNPTITGGPWSPPWTGTLDVANGKNTVTGALMFTAVFDTPAGTVSCSWSAGKVKGRFNHDGNPINIQTTGQKFSLVAGSNSMCPAKGKLTATWALTTKPVGSESFFDVFTE
jgi:hypothetical protein